MQWDKDYFKWKIENGGGFERRVGDVESVQRFWYKECCRFDVRVRSRREEE